MPGTSRRKDQEMDQGRTNDNFQGRTAESGEGTPLDSSKKTSTFVDGGCGEKKRPERDVSRILSPEGPWGVKAAARAGLLFEDFWPGQQSQVNKKNPKV